MIISIEDRMTRLADYIDDLALSLNKSLHYLCDFIIDFGRYCYKIMYFSKDEFEQIQKLPWYKVARLCTYPWHYIWILGFFYKAKAKVKTLIYDKPGVHLIIGGPGSGKSSLMYLLMERMRIEFGKPSYINSLIEKKRMSEDYQYYYRYHNLFDFTDFWRDRRMVKEPNKDLFAAIFIDEAHRILNYRENGSTDYNDRFIPFLSYAVLVRQKIKKIFLATQMGKVDTQLMSLAETITQPRINIGFDYPEWLLGTGLFRFQILGFYIDQYGLDVNGDKTKKPIKSFYIKNEWADYDYFDTYAMSGEYSHVPKDMPKNMIKGRVIVE